MKSPGKLTLFLLATAIAGFGCNTSINSPIVVGNGETRSGSLSTVNGRITIGDNCRIDGSCRTVNGAIEVGDESRVEGLNTVNGSIRAGAGVVVEGDVGTVNGAVSIGSGSRIEGEVATINGEIDLVRTTVAQDIRISLGNVRLLDGTTVKGDVVFEKKMGSPRPNRTLEVEISGGSVVQGDLIVEDPELRVEVVLRDGGQVLGEIEGADVVGGR